MADRVREAIVLLDLSAVARGRAVNMSIEYVMEGMATDKASDDGARWREAGKRRLVRVP